MGTCWISDRSLLIVATLCILWLGPVISTATQPVQDEAIHSVFKDGLEQIFAGGLEDSLPACLARIPAEASAGQRLLAVDSCKQDEVVRTLSHIEF